MCYCYIEVYFSQQSEFGVSPECSNNFTETILRRSDTYQGKLNVNKPLFLQIISKHYFGK